MSPPLLRIGELAERAGTTPRTIRYYESLGLLRPPARTAGGMRHYGAQDLARLQKIDALKAVGLTLEEIASVIELYFEDATGVRGKRRVREILQQHLHETDEKLDALQRFRAELRANIARMDRLIAEAERR